MKTKLGPIEDTLFIPLIGRIIASEKYPTHIQDKKAILLKSKLFQDPKIEKLYNKYLNLEYDVIKSATRSRTMDRLAQNFIDNNENAIIVLLGCGLETTFYRLDNGKTIWYEVDLENVIEYRKKIIGETPRDICISSDAFSDTWLKEIKSKHPDSPILIIAGGFLYYFDSKIVMNFFKMLRKEKNISIALEVMNKYGIGKIKKNVKKLGLKPVNHYFIVNDPKKLAKSIKGNLQYSENIYESVIRKNLSISTRITMFLQDLFRQAKIIKIKFE